MWRIEPSSVWAVFSLPICRLHQWLHIYSTSGSHGVSNVVSIGFSIGNSVEVIYMLMRKAIGLSTGASTCHEIEWIPSYVLEIPVKSCSFCICACTE